MAINKQTFYEGAALYLVARTGDVTSIRYESPFFVLNNRLLVLLKYSTGKRSPWGFTFTADEQEILKNTAPKHNPVLALVCGADGVAAVPYDAYLKIASLRETAIRVACYRQHGEHYEVSGPDGVLANKVAPSMWQRILRP